MQKCSKILHHFFRSTTIEIKIITAELPGSVELHVVGLYRRETIKKCAKMRSL